MDREWGAGCVSNYLDLPVRSRARVSIRLIKSRTARQYRDSFTNTNYAIIIEPAGGSILYFSEIFSGGPDGGTRRYLYTANGGR